MGQSPAFSAPHSAENPELIDRFDRVLSDTVQAMEQSGIKYLFIGGIASSGLGRPRTTQDIDLFVMPEDAETALRALSANGFKIERTDPSWLYKAFKEDILVDVIFRSKGEIYLDQEMYRRMTTAEFHGKRLRFVAPEDLLIIKAAAHSELTPNHWHDAVALLSHASLDWEYLIKRARKAPRRTLSVLLYAQSNDVWVPNRVVHELFDVIFGSGAPERPKSAQTAQPHAPAAPTKPGSLAPPPSYQPQTYQAPAYPAGQGLPQPSVAKVHPMPGRQTSNPEIVRAEYDIGHLREILAEDPRTHELNVQIEQHGRKLILKGEVASASRREAIEQVTRERLPAFGVENQIQVIPVGEPDESEAIE